MKNNIDEDIKTVKEFKENGYATLMIKYDKDRIQTNTMVERALENVLSELETYKKIAEKLAELINNHDIDEDVCRQMGKDFECTLFNQDEKFCVQCIIDWARKEVEKDV